MKWYRKWKRERVENRNTEYNFLWGIRLEKCFFFAFANRKIWIKRQGMKVILREEYKGTKIRANFFTVFPNGSAEV